MNTLRTIAAAGALLLVTARAGADDFHATLERQKAEAETLSAEALAHAKKGDFEAARSLYAKAFAQYPNTKIVFNWALAELNSGHELEALHHFRWYLRERDADAASVEIIKKRLLERALRVTGHIKVEQRPSGSELTVDGQAAVEEPEDHVVDVAPGLHTVAATLGTTSLKAEVTVRAGETVTASLEPIRAPETAPTTPLPTRTQPPVPLAPTPPSRTQHDPFWNKKQVFVASFGGAMVVAEAVAFAFWVPTWGKPGPAQGPDQPIAITAGATAGALFLATMGVIILMPDHGSRGGGVSIQPTFDPSSRSLGVVGRF